ncbi:MAG: dTMP kinase [Bacillota bacterium]|nr:dTMP kinase [Bacillota bacterium]
MARGYFISFEGMDGSGKSTQIRRLKQHLEGRGYDVVLTREPGGTEIGEKIRTIILDKDHSQMTDLTEAMLYAASRAQHVAEVIKPAIDRGQVVICDRFVDSSIAYQGYGRGLGDSVQKINDYAIGDYLPDVTFLMKVKPTVSTDRIKHREKDRIELEPESFHEAVYRGYEELEHRFPERITAIDATRTIEETEREILKRIDRLIDRNGTNNSR